MIAILNGRVKEINEQSIVVCTKHIGFEVFVIQPRSFTYNEEIVLNIHMHWNQEQGPSFFGFKTKEEKAVFQSIIKCPGIGPKIALAALEHLGHSSFVQAVTAEDSGVLSSIPGIGNKKAEQLLVQLKHPIKKLLEQGLLVDHNCPIAELQKIGEVLDSLNYSRSEINTALEFLRKSDHANGSFDLLLRQALSYLSKRV